ncbi:MAG: Hsp70 family protein [Phycisphaerales bacterium]|nr:Hsp70 family protein [Phycisphaerales bacterium]
MPELIVGIDLGTTNSLVAVCDEGGPRVIPDDRGRPLLPSVVRYSAGGVTAGYAAREGTGEGATVSSVKRLMGRSPADVRADLAFLPYGIVEGPNQTARIKLSPSQTVSPQEVSAVILRSLRDRASAALGAEVRKAVITVPAYFDDAQRQATRDAARLAGLDAVRIVAEPTAAALAYGLGVGDESRRGRAETVAVFDLGGGTLDVSILRRTPPGAPGGTEFFQVLSTAGDTHLGGDDVDHALAALLLRESGGAAATGAAVAAAESAKCRLSEFDAAEVRLPIASGGEYRRTVTRGELEGLMEPWIARAMACCERAVRDAGPRLRRTAGGAGGVGGLDAVILVGGSTRIPLVRRRVQEYFGLVPYTAIHPDLAVALGAAVQAGVLSGAVKGALLLDVIPLSLGVGTVGGAVAKLILRNSTVPARATEMFSTSVDGQTSIKLSVYQGEREMAADCRRLGEFHLRGLPPMPAGIPQLEVEFLVDASGVLQVSAHERRSGRRASLQVVPNHGLTRDEVSRMEAESLAHAREDLTRHRVVDLVVNAKLDLKWIGERLERFRDKLDAAYAAELDGLVASLRGFVLRGDADWASVDSDAFHRAKEALDRASVRLQEVGITESLKQP